MSLHHQLVALLKVMEYELGDRQVVVHLGWPLSSWLDRLAIGVMVFNLMRLPRLFPKFQFHLSYTGMPKRSAQPPPEATKPGDAGDTPPHLVASWPAPAVSSG